MYTGEVWLCSHSNQVPGTRTAQIQTKENQAEHATYIYTEPVEVISAVVVKIFNSHLYA